MAEMLTAWSGMAVALVVVCAFATTSARAAEDPCPLLTSLRKMSDDHFKKQRGKALDQYQDSFATAYHMPGADECTIEIVGSKYSELRCRWYLQRGIEAEPKAKDQFLETANNFQGCAKDRDGMEVRRHRDGRGGYVELTDRFVDAAAGSDYTISIRYMWSAPWWYLYVEYRRSDP